MFQIGDDWFELKSHVDENCNQIINPPANHEFEECIKIEQLEVHSDLNDTSSNWNKQNNVDFSETDLLQCHTEIKSIQIGHDEKSAATTNKINENATEYADNLKIECDKNSENKKENCENDGDECTNNDDDDDDVDDIKYSEPFEDNSSLPCVAKAIRLNPKIKTVRNTTLPKAKSKQTLNKIPTPCEHCNKVLSSYPSYWKHVRAVHKIRPTYQCEVCDQKFNKTQTLWNHLKEAHAANRFMCELCNRTFKYRSKLEEHKERKHLRLSLTCDICQKRLCNRESLISHMKIHAGTNRKFKCDLCKKAFNTKVLVTQHKQIEHEGQVLYGCGTCGKSCKSKGMLLIHEKMHRDVREFVCDHCGLKFRAKQILQQHINTHTGMKPYLCTTCGKAFSHISQLSSHKRIHTKEKMYKCDIGDCDRAFMNCTNRKRHRFTVHGVILDNEKRHICHICSKVYPLKEMLVNHLKSH